MKGIDETLIETKEIYVNCQKACLQLKGNCPTESVVAVEVSFLKEKENHEGDEHVDHHVGQKKTVEESE